jgi:hypothetical protein
MGISSDRSPGTLQAQMGSPVIDGRTPALMLPGELWRNIAGHLDPGSFVALTQTASAFRSLVDETAVLRRVMAQSRLSLSSEAYLGLTKPREVKHLRQSILAEAQLDARLRQGPIKLGSASEEYDWTASSSWLFCQHASTAGDSALSVIRSAYPESPILRLEKGSAHCSQFCQDDDALLVQETTHGPVWMYDLLARPLVRHSVVPLQQMEITSMVGVCANKVFVSRGNELLTYERREGEPFRQAASHPFEDDIEIKQSSCSGRRAVVELPEIYTQRVVDLEAGGAWKNCYEVEFSACRCEAIDLSRLGHFAQVTHCGDEGSYICLDSEFYDPGLPHADWKTSAYIAEDEHEFVLHAKNEYSSRQRANFLVKTELMHDTWPKWLIDYHVEKSRGYALGFVAERDALVLMDRNNFKRVRKNSEQVYVVRDISDEEVYVPAWCRGIVQHRYIDAAKSAESYSIKFAGIKTSIEVAATDLRFMASP